MPTFDGLPACSCHVEWIPVYRAELKRQGVSSIRLTRLIYRGGGTSGDTHWPGGGGDGILSSIADYSKAVKIARNMGAAAWHRTPAQGFIHHLHFVLVGCPHNAGGRYQITALNAGYNGLGYMGRGGRDDGPRSGIKWPLRTYKQGIAWAKARQAPTYTDYYVKAPFAQGHSSTSATSSLVGNKKPWGSRLRVLSTKTVNGAKWGWVDPTGYPGRWYLMSNLSTNKPTTKIQKVGTLTVGEYNVAAQSKGHAATYNTRASRSAQLMVDRGADVIGVVEYGSSADKHPSGFTYLQISDRARKAASDGNLVRVAHGEKWRHILRRLDTTDYVANSGRAVTLPTRVDSDGTQIVMAALTKLNVRTGVVVVHFDVNSTAAQFRAQARETLAAADAWRREMNIQPWNMTYTGDHNDIGPDVRAVFATWGFVPTARGDDQGRYRTTNSWVDKLTVGPRRDDTFVPEGASQGYHLWIDAVASDHNYTQSVRAIYGTA